MSRVYLDDCRKAPFGWELVKTAADCIARLEGGDVSELSLDHDLAFEHYSGALDSRTGYAVVLWLENRVREDPSFRMPHVTLHTMNPVGRDHMAAGLLRIEEFIRQRDGGE